MRAIKEAIRYVLAAPLVGLVDFGLYYLLNTFLAFSLAKAISYIAATVVGYVINKYWTFECRGPSYREARRYLIVQILLFGCNVGTNHILRSLWPDAVFYAFLGASLSTGLISFLSKKFWVFNAPPKPYLQG